MAVAFDAASTLQVFTGDTSWLHTPSGTPAGALVIVTQRVTGADQIAGITYGAVAMGEVTASPKVFGNGAAYAYFLSAPPTGAQTVAVDTTSTAGKRAISFTVTSGTGLTSVVASDGVAANVDDPSVSLAAGAATAWVGMGMHSDTLAAVGDITPGGTYTSVAERDDGTDTMEIARLTTPTTGSITANFTTTAASDLQMIAVAIIEAAAGGGGTVADPFGMSGFFGA